MQVGAARAETGNRTRRSPRHAALRKEDQGDWTKKRETARASSAGTVERVLRPCWESESKSAGCLKGANQPSNTCPRHCKCRRSVKLCPSHIHAGSANKKPRTRVLHWTKCA